ncbi:unnamed protein product [Bursaphelenchus okinawaensis]|uniref:Uncharacterized protein n=1 Tax=Bursaphelenchus okinawaensis TaxID=465554 RepID=A0A811K7D5_9BILA|nr:unnamed protein product [Bursaphelenchus okinawaensis]CAG9094079.1 unnamed protein product [Bursaphelenchus okinawaensis]
MGNEQSSSSKKAITKGLGVIKGGPSNSKVQSHLENAKKSRILQLKNCNIKTVPEAIDEVAEILRNLDLADNRIIEITFDFKRFTALKHLNLHGNKLTKLPDSVGSLKSLETFDVSDNQLDELPDSIAACINLKSVNASNNKLTSFPSGTCLLPALEFLDLSGNLIDSLPESICDLKASELNLNRNRLNTLHDNLAKCQKLRILRVEENCLNKTAFTVAILKESSLSLICYSGNLLNDTEFQHLNGYEEYQERFTATKRKGV